jgi:hypothetical protein
LAFSGGYRLPEGRADFLFRWRGAEGEGALWYLDPDDQHVIGLAALGFGFCEGLLKQRSLRAYTISYTISHHKLSFWAAASAL